MGTRWAVDTLADPGCTFSAAGRTVELSPEQTANAATIAAVAGQRGLPPRAVTIALATAIQESKLRNLLYGDADSQGLFQQRPSQGWGTVEQVTDPVYAAGAFYDALVQVEGWEQGVVTEVAQEVQRSAYPDAYADHEWEGRVLASVLTGQEGSSTELACELDEPVERGSADRLAAKLREQAGVTGQVDVGANTLTLTATGSAHAWALAAWAVAHAEAEQVVRVDVDGRSWRRGEESGGFGADGDAPAGGTTVVVQVH